MAFDNEAVLTVVLKARNELSAVLAGAGMQVEALGAKARASGLMYGSSGGAGGLVGFEERRAMGMYPGMGGAAGLLGFTPGMMAVGAGGIAATGLFEVGKALLNTYEEQQKAVGDLNQAYTAAGLDFGTAQKRIEDWIDANAPYIQNVNQAREGFATLTRSGLQQNVVMQAMTEAMNLAAVKHIDLNTAVEVITKAYQGQGKGLIDMGIHMSQFDGATGLVKNHVLDQARLTKDLNKVLDDSAKKIYPPLQQAQDKLGKDLDHLATVTGPGFEAAMVRWTNIMDASVNTLANAFSGLGNMGNFFNQGWAPHPQRGPWTPAH